MANTGPAMVEFTPDTFDPAAENPITLEDARKVFPRQPSGKRVTVRTIQRWIRHGYRGVRLQAVAAGRTLSTSEESCRRFMRRVAESLNSSPRESRPAPSADAERAMQELQRRGY